MSLSTAGMDLGVVEIGLKEITDETWMQRKKLDVWVEMEVVKNCKKFAGKWSMMPEFRKQSLVSHN